MDPVSQGVLGAAVGYSLYHRQLGRRAALIGGLSGMAADLDVFLRSDAAPTLQWVMHRHFTHSLFFAPIGGVICALAFMLFPSLRRPTKYVIYCSIAGYLTHGWLDVFTSYGTLWFWPFTNVRLALDCAPIIDPIYTFCLLVGVAWALIKSETGPAKAGLVLSTLYLAFGGVQHYRAQSAQDLIIASRLQQNLVEHARVMPSPGSLVIWRSAYRTANEVYADAIRVPWFRSATVSQEGHTKRMTFMDLPVAVQQSAEARRQFQILDWFSDGFTVSTPDNPYLVGDGRILANFHSPKPLWGLIFSPDRPNSPIRWRTNKSRRDNIGEYLEQIVYGSGKFKVLGER